MEFPDGYKTSMTANCIAENMFSQVDEEGHRHVLMDTIIDTRTDGNQIMPSEAYIELKSGAKRRIETTKGWQVLIQWKNSSTTWNVLKDIKDSYPVQLAEYAIEDGISEQPVFVWWVNFVIKKG